MSRDDDPGAVYPAQGVKLEGPPRLAAEGDLAVRDAGGQHLVEHLGHVVVHECFEQRAANQ